MEEVVAIKVVDAKRTAHYFMTWGRAFDVVRPEPLVSAIRRRLQQFGIRAVRSIRVCDTLQAAADQPYFYEALISFSRQPVPNGRAYPKWRTIRRKQIEAGKEIYYLGKRDTKLG